MPVDYAEVLKELEAEEGRLMTQLNTVRAAKPAIMLLMNNQKSEPPIVSPPLPAGRFARFGATRAIQIYMTGNTVALTSRQIMDGLKAEGWTSESEDHLATISATLSQLRDKGVVRKSGDGWLPSNTGIDITPLNDPYFVPTGSEPLSSQ